MKELRWNGHDDRMLKNYMGDSFVYPHDYGHMLTQGFVIMPNKTTLSTNFNVWRHTLKNEHFFLCFTTLKKQRKPIKWSWKNHPTYIIRKQLALKKNYNVFKEK
jgi:hypothetical protein